MTTMPLEIFLVVQRYSVICISANLCLRYNSLISLVGNKLKHAIGKPKHSAPIGLAILPLCSGGSEIDACFEMLKRIPDQVLDF
jgi:hypothetical protein